MNLNQECEVKVEKLVNEGKGLARINNMPVFIDNACPNDELKIKITKINKHYLTGEIVSIIKPSEYRITPVCSLHNVCGSCNWQHIDYSCQLEQKKNIVFETLKNITGRDFVIENTIASPKIQGYRCKIQYPVAQKKSGRIISGYYKKNSHELINIKYCPMQNDIINDITEFIKEECQKLGISGYNEKLHSGILRHIIFRHSADLENILIILVINDNKVNKKIELLADLLINKYSAIKGICANFNTKKTNVILGINTQKVRGVDFYLENLSEKKYKISANSFFQVNPLCAEIIFNTVKKLISDRLVKPVILDAYSGVSSFGIWMCDIASKVVCIEEVKSASEDAKENADINNCVNIEIINGDAAEKFSELINKNMKFDVVITDPPRKGCSPESVKNIISLTDKYIIYVSCNISTLARDMNILIENGFLPQYIQPVDMFPNTYHVETIVLFKKKQ